jgi:hypothetical protein
MQAEGGQSGEVDGAGSGQDVGQDAFVSTAAGFSAAPGVAGEVADLAFHDGPVGPVCLPPGRILLARFGVLQGGFLGVDADHPTAASFRASARSGQEPQSAPKWATRWRRPARMVTMG